jgi:hypothetical protein
MTAAATLDPGTSAQFLGGLGFLLTPDGDGTDAPAYLLVALRQEPTLQHFDPERVGYWMEARGRGTEETFSRATSLPLDGSFSWGPIRILDRLEIANDYLSFGGRLSAARLGGFTVAVFASAAPILRGNGHSQTEDPGAPNVTAFFARLRAAAGASRDVELRILHATPQGRYAAYLAGACERYRQSQTLQLTYPQMWQSLVRQERRLRAERPSAWSEGHALLPLLHDPSATLSTWREARDVGT